MRGMPMRSDRARAPQIAATLCGALFAAAPSGAETLAQAYGLGATPPQPEVWLKFGPDMSVRARVLDAAGAPAETARPGEKLHLALEFRATEGAADRPLDLTCAARFYDAEGTASDYRGAPVPCYHGRLADGADHFQPIDFTFVFVNGAEDPPGTAAVVASVRDRVSGLGRELAPTYRLGR